MFRKKRIDFLVIGAQKCGTSSFYKYLIQHPQINPARKKELHFFDNFYEKGLKWYHSHFIFNKRKITGEASPFYILHPSCARRVYQYNPKMRIIVLLRNPVDRAISHYKMMVSMGFEKLSFYEALMAEEDRLKISANPDLLNSNLQLYSYKTRGLYVQQLKEWEAYFPKKQILIVNYHQFFQSPWENLEAVYNFLEISEGVNEPVSFLENASKSKFRAGESEIQLLQKYFKKPNEELANQYNIHFE